MNLGAPILDAAAGSVAIISDGVVTAPGYDPVVITTTESNKDFQIGDTFNPDVDFEYDEQTELEKETEQVYVNRT